MVRVQELPSLTGIRAVAAFWVVFYHIRNETANFVFPTLKPVIHAIFDPGYLAVDLFFILSGFILSYNYWEKLTALSVSQYGAFLGMRIARIYPVYLTTLLLMALMGLFAKATHMTTHYNLSRWTLPTFVENVLLVQQWSLHPSPSWNGPAWSISCEWLTYMLFPMFPRLFALRRAATAFCVAIAILAALAAVGQLVNYNGSVEDGPAGVVRVLTGFTAGCLLFGAFRQRSCIRSYRISATAGAIGITAVLAVCSLWQTTAATWTIPFFGLLIYGLTDQTHLLSRVLSTRPIVSWGEASYSLYAVHSPVMMVLGKIMPFSWFGSSPLWMRCLVLAGWILAVGIVAKVTYTMVEKPCRKAIWKWLHAEKRNGAARDGTGFDSVAACGE